MKKRILVYLIISFMILGNIFASGTIIDKNTNDKEIDKFEVKESMPPFMLDEIVVGFDGNLI